jgi:hypothetical protein
MAKANGNGFVGEEKMERHVQVGNKPEDEKQCGNNNEWARVAGRTGRSDWRSGFGSHNDSFSASKP